MEKHDSVTVELEDIPLTGEKAKRLADKAGVHIDQRWTADACAQLVGRRRRHFHDEMCMEAIHDAALVRYARCFKTGARDLFTIPRAWISDLSAHLLQAHQDAIDLRDKHIAHALNDWEVNIPLAHVARAGPAATVKSVSIRATRAQLGTRPLRSLHELAKALADRVHKAMSVLHAEVLREAQRTAPRELKKRAPREFPRPARRKIGTDRRRG